MKLINFAIKSAFVTGALTAGAFITGATIGMLVNKDKVFDKFKKMQIKKNDSASTKQLDFEKFITSYIKKKGVNMNKFLIALSFCISTFLFSNFSEAAHCSGGHKEIKETSEETSETTKETKSN